MARRRKDRDFWESADLNTASYIQYYDRLTELSISMFDWQNLPDTVDPRFLELTLFANGMAVFFQNEAGDYLALQCAISGPLDVYRIPTRRRAYAVNGSGIQADLPFLSGNGYPCCADESEASGKASEDQPDAESGIYPLESAAAGKIPAGRRGFSGDAAEADRPSAVQCAPGREISSCLWVA